MRKKILFFIFDLGGGGAEKVLVQLVNALPEEKYDITVQTIFNVGANLEQLKPNIHRKWLFNRMFHGMRYIVRLFSPSLLHRMLVREQYDYEIAYLEGVPTRVISGCNNPGTKKFAWVHTEMIDPSYVLSCYRTTNEAKNIYESFDRIAFVSDVAQKAFLLRTGWHHLKTSVVHNTINVRQIIECSREAIDLKLDKIKINLCSVGKLVEVKGYHRLLNILCYLKGQGFINWHLYLLGEGDKRAQLEKTIKDNDMKDYVTLLGYDNNPYKYVAKMDFFVCSSYREGYSTAVTESIILGTPVITTNCSGMREILGDDGGIIVNNDDKALQDGLLSLLSNPNLVERFREGAKKRSKVFSIENTVKDFERFIALTE